MQEPDPNSDYLWVLPSDSPDFAPDDVAGPGFGVDPVVDATGSQWWDDSSDAGSSFGPGFNSDEFEAILWGGDGTLRAANFGNLDADSSFGSVSSFGSADMDLDALHSMSSDTGPKGPEAPKVSRGGGWFGGLSLGLNRGAKNDEKKTELRPLLPPQKDNSLKGRIEASVRGCIDMSAEAKAELVKYGSASDWKKTCNDALEGTDLTNKFIALHALLVLVECEITTKRKLVSDKITYAEISDIDEGNLKGDIANARVIIDTMVNNSKGATPTGFDHIVNAVVGNNTLSSSHIPEFREIKYKDGKITKRCHDSEATGRFVEALAKDASNKNITCNLHNKVNGKDLLGVELAQFLQEAGKGLLDAKLNIGDDDFDGDRRTFQLSQDNGSYSDMMKLDQMIVLGGVAQELVDHQNGASLDGVAQDVHNALNDAGHVDDYNLDQFMAAYKSLALTREQGFSATGGATVGVVESVSATVSPGGEMAVDVMTENARKVSLVLDELAPNGDNLVYMKVDQVIGKPDGTIHGDSGDQAEVAYAKIGVATPAADADAGAGYIDVDGVDDPAADGDGADAAPADADDDAGRLEFG